MANHHDIFTGARLFVFGLEVTQDLISYSPTWTDGRSPSSISIQLANEFDRYITTHDDLTAVYDDVDVTSAVGPVDILSAVKARLDRAIGDKSKRAVMRAKVSHLVPAVVTPGVNDASRAATAGSLNGLLQLRGEAHRYPFVEGESIFHTQDPITLFERDTRTGQWFWGFCGFGTAFTFDEDAQGRSVLNITAEGPMRLFRYARVTFDPGILDYDYVKTQYDSEIRVWTKEALADLTLPEALYTITYGSDIRVPGPNQPDGRLAGTELPAYTRVSITGTATRAKRSDGVGAFDFDRSEVLEIGGNPGQSELPQVTSVAGKSIESVSSLAEWQARIDHAVLPSDLETRFADLDDHLDTYNEFVRSARRRVLVPGGGERLEWDIDSVIETIGTHPQHYPVDGGRLMMLVPKSLGAGVNRDLLLKDIIQGPSMNTQFSTRLRLILDLVERIEFSFYETPKGDLICEMPLYDFAPASFGNDRVIAPRTTRTDFDDTARGPYGPRYEFLLEDILAVSTTFNDERVRTQMVVPYFIVDQELGGTSKEVGLRPGSVLLDHLVPQFGVRFEEIPPQAFIRGEQAANVYANIKLNLWNADARSAQVPVVPRLGIGPNRPCWIEKRNFIGTSRVVSRSVAWNESYSQSLALNYVRRFAGQHDAFGREVYEPVGGFGGRPLNYALLFSGQAVLPPLRTRNAASDAPASTPALPPAATKTRRGHLTWNNPRTQSLSDPEAEANAQAVELFVNEVIRPLVEANGLDVTIASLYRTEAQQRRLREKFGARHAPANSDHLNALALDLGPPEIVDALQELLQQEVLSGVGPYRNEGQYIRRLVAHTTSAYHLHVSFRSNIRSRRSRQ